jgi:hypothetical protein
VQGLELSRRFYAEAVRPVLERHFPNIDHAAARIGWGSEVLGFDDDTSQDHQWGPRLELFLRDLEPAQVLADRLARELPTEFAGFPTHFGPTDEPGTVRMTAIESGPIDHRVEIWNLRERLHERLGVDPLTEFAAADWLVTPTQRLLEWTAGAVFHDAIGELTRLRQLLSWYPHDVWLLAMAGHWQRIGQFEHLHGRTGLRDDELGSRVLGAAIVRDLMRLALLQERRYAPYPKWLGTAYAQLGRPEAEPLEAALRAADFRARESALVEACEAAARAHNELGVTERLDPAARRFWGRPIRIIGGERFSDALHRAIGDPELRAIEHHAGAVDAVSDNTDVLTSPLVWRQLVGLYDRR